MLNGGHIYLEGIMSSVNKNQIEVGHYVVIQHTHSNRNCGLYPFRVLRVQNTKVEVSDANGGTSLIDIRDIAFCGKLDFIHGVIESELAGIVDQYLTHEATDIIIKEKVKKLCGLNKLHH